MEVKVLNKEGKATAKKVTLSAGIFGVEPNDHAIYLDVKQYLANQGKVHTKLEKEVKSLEVQEKLKNKREQVPQELDLLKIHCSEAVEEFLDLDQKLMVLNLIRKLKY